MLNTEGLVVLSLVHEIAKESANGAIPFSKVRNSNELHSKIVYDDRKPKKTWTALTILLSLAPVLTNTTTLLLLPMMTCSRNFPLLLSTMTQGIPITILSVFG